MKMRLFWSELELRLAKSSNNPGSLTRLYNYRHFQSQLGIEMMRARRSSLPMCLFAIEIDDFNLFATNRENQLAEKVIQETAAILRTVCRSTDVISRKDKSLFLLICPDTPMLGATIVAEKIRTAIAANQVQSQRGPVKITVSLGAAFFPAQAIIAKDLLDICLANLGKAHSDGGNCAKIDPQTISPQKS
jgi:diguanylate cyclase (GGDEF)-like protein